MRRSPLVRSAMPVSPMPKEVVRFLTQCRTERQEPLASRLQELLRQQPRTKGGARTWRFECAALLTVCLQAACQGVGKGEATHCACGGRTAADLAYRFVKFAATNFKANSKTSWWPWVALASGLLGMPVRDLSETLPQVSSHWAFHLAETYHFAMRRFNLEPVLPVPGPGLSGTHSVGGALPVNKRPVADEVGRPEDEIARIMADELADPWQVLALPQRSSAGDIRARFRKLALLIHPDKVEHPDAHLAFCKLNEASEMALRRARRR